MTRPATELKAATASDETRVSLRAATASGWLTAAQKEPHPPLKAWLTRAARGRTTSRLR